jgi:hypothetical protein
MASDKTRFYIKIDGSFLIKRFINVMSITDSGGKIQQFKITFEGIKPYQDWTFAGNAVADSISGVRSIKSKYPHTGEISVGYHSNGNVLCKLENKNFKPTRYPPIDKIRKAVFFLRMSGFCLDNLEKASSKKDKVNEQTITLWSIF